MVSGLAGHHYLNGGKRMIDNITLWHRRARPEPTEKDFNVQLGCHLEEFVEMLDALTISGYPGFLKAIDTIEEISEKLKNGTLTISTVDRVNLLDSLADQIVTAVGVGVCAKMDMDAAVEEVNRSNWSKFNYKGFPEFDENGKVKKGEHYRKPNLKGMY